MTQYLRKGDRVFGRWYEATDASISGSMPKVGVIAREVSGVVRHIRANTPDATDAEAIFIDPDPGWDGPTMRPPRCTCPDEHVMLKPAWIVPSPDDDIFGSSAFARNVAVGLTAPDDGDDG